MSTYLVRVCSRTGRWRTVLQSDREAEARAWFLALSTAGRPGGQVTLQTSDGTVLEWHVSRARGYDHDPCASKDHYEAALAADALRQEG